APGKSIRIFNPAFSPHFQTGANTRITRIRTRFGQRESHPSYPVIRGQILPLRSRSGAGFSGKKAGKMGSVIRIQKMADFGGFAKGLQKCLTQRVYLTQRLIFAPIPLIHNNLRGKYRASPPARKAALSYRWSFFQLFANGSSSAGCKAGFSKAPQNGLKCTFMPKKRPIFLR